MCIEHLAFGEVLLSPIFSSCVGSLLWGILTQASLKIIFLLIGCPLAIFPFWEEKVGVDTTHELGLNGTKLSPPLSGTAGMKNLKILKKKNTKNKQEAPVRQLCLLTLEEKNCLSTLTYSLELCTLLIQANQEEMKSG